MTAVGSRTQLDDSYPDARAALAALEAKAVRVETPCGEGDMVWRRWGEGEPLILIHGGSGSWAHWVRNIPVLSRTRAVWCADIPGFGDSAKPAPPYNIDTIVPAIVEGTKRILPEGQRFDLTGFSFGAMVSTLVAAAMGDRVRNLVVVGSGGLGLPTATSGSMQRWRDLPDAERKAAIQYNIGILMLHDRKHADDLALFIYERDLRHSRLDSRRTHRPGMMNEALPHVRARLGGIWGEYDPLARDRFDTVREFFAKVQPGFPLHVIQGAGHWVAYEAAEPFNAALQGLLARS